MNNKTKEFAKVFKKSLVLNECKHGRLVEGKSALSVSTENGIVKWWSYNTIIAIEEPNGNPVITKYGYSRTTSRKHVPAIRMFYERNGTKPTVLDIPIHGMYR